jgi:hypothetical protein
MREIFQSVQSEGFSPPRAGRNIFLGRLIAGFLGVLRFLNAAITRNEQRTVQVNTWKIRGI